MRIYISTLGCARNQVDSEVMSGRLSAAGHETADLAENAEVIIVNTCAFIESAADEAIEQILELAEYKRHGACQKLIVAGCLPQRYGQQTAEALPEVDLFLGTGAYDRITDAVENTKASEKCVLPPPEQTALAGAGVPRVRAPGPVAYVKIMEGCGRHCTYCIIPALRGPLRSRPAADIACEARRLAGQGAAEIVLVGQDTTSWGLDQTPPSRFADLLAQVAQSVPDCWLRFLYGHPDRIGDRLLETMAVYPNICRYLDIPVQHASSRVLKRMGRGHDSKVLAALFDRIRSAMPDAALRTTVLVGFPGETDDDFAKLLEFMEQVAFDHLGAFVYSDAEDLPAHRLNGHVPAQIAQDRHDILMMRQADISLAKNRKKIGQCTEVLVEDRAEDGRLCGRTRFQAPEVDGVTFIDNPGKSVVPGRIMKIRITDADEYDLTGVAI
ncbi:MAG: 30S ribosomal protein S12 methylthiotransferase RimO [Desulfosalsimonas sp.]|uniref:30S ribosomal protein S12 methylthiotransferase RimO n=1 Tax=Desulfosalsimonas sp. TaxID=3073848 RepID=UPI0039708F63